MCNSGVKSAFIIENSKKMKNNSVLVVKVIDLVQFF